MALQDGSVYYYAGKYLPRKDRLKRSIPSSSTSSSSFSRKRARGKKVKQQEEEDMDTNSDSNSDDGSSGEHGNSNKLLFLRYVKEVDGAELLVR